MTIKLVLGNLFLGNARLVLRVTISIIRHELLNHP